MFQSHLLEGGNGHFVGHELELADISATSLTGTELIVLEFFVTVFDPAINCFLSMLQKVMDSGIACMMYDLQFFFVSL